MIITTIVIVIITFAIIVVMIEIIVDSFWNMHLLHCCQYQKLTGINLTMIREMTWPITINEQASSLL